MDSFDILFNLGVSAILAVVKNPQKRDKVKAALLKVARAISAAFPGEV